MYCPVRVQIAEHELPRRRPRFRLGHRLKARAVRLRRRENPNARGPGQPWRSARDGSAARKERRLRLEHVREGHRRDIEHNRSEVRIARTPSSTDPGASPTSQGSVAAECGTPCGTLGKLGNQVLGESQLSTARRANATLIARSASRIEPGAGRSSVRDHARVAAGSVMRGADSRQCAAARTNSTIPGCHLSRASAQLVPRMRQDGATRRIRAAIADAKAEPGLYLDSAARTAPRNRGVVGDVLRGEADSANKRGMTPAASAGTVVGLFIADAAAERNEVAETVAGLRCVEAHAACREVVMSSAPSKLLEKNSRARSRGPHRGEGMCQPTGSRDVECGGEVVGRRMTGRSDGGTGRALTTGGVYLVGDP